MIGTEGRKLKEGKCRLLLPGACEPRLTLARAQGLKFRYFQLLTQPELPEHDCHWQLCFMYR